jgi:hypothetical protein
MPVSLQKPPVRELWGVVTLLSMGSRHHRHHDLQRFRRDLNLCRCLTSHLPLEGRILWIRGCGNSHSSCLEMMDARDTRQLRRVARRIGCECPRGLFRWEVLWVKEMG